MATTVMAKVLTEYRYRIVRSIPYTITVSVLQPIERILICF